jgi:hypothetical protein
MPLPEAIWGKHSLKCSQALADIALTARRLMAALPQAAGGTPEASTSLKPETRYDSCGKTATKGNH